jgi:hypothetical protein
MSEEKKRLLLSLYGEKDDVPTPPALRDEAEALRAMKYHLDARPRMRPAPVVLERISAEAERVAAESAPATTVGVRANRSSSRALRLVRAGTRLAAVLVAMAIGWHWFAPADPVEVVESGTPEHELAASVPPVAEAPAIMVEEPAGSPASPPARARGSSPATEVIAESAEVNRDWEAASDLLMIQRRLEMLGALDWDEPAFPLEMMPNSTGTPGFRQAGDGRDPTAW